MTRSNVRLALGESGRGLAAVTIGATEHDILARVHAGILDAAMTLQATRAFAHRLREGLIDPISRRRHTRRRRQVARDGNGRTKTRLVREKRTAHGNQQSGHEKSSNPGRGTGNGERGMDAANERLISTKGTKPRGI